MFETLNMAILGNATCLDTSYDPTFLPFLPQEDISDLRFKLSIPPARCMGGLGQTWSPAPPTPLSNVWLCNVQYKGSIRKWLLAVGNDRRCVVGFFFGKRLASGGKQFFSKRAPLVCHLAQRMPSVRNIFGRFLAALLAAPQHGHCFGTKSN